VSEQVADVVGGTNIYYVPDQHDQLPVVGLTLGTGVSLALDSNSGHTGYHQSGHIFDLFLWNSAGTLFLVTGPAWSSGTASLATRGIDYTTVAGLPTNTTTMTVKYSTAVGGTASVGAGSLLWVGSAYMTANGQCTCQFNPAAASGGANTILGLYNAFNSHHGSAQSQSSTASWSYNSATWRTAGSSASNRVTWLDGGGDVNVEAQYICNMVEGSATGDFPEIGINFNATTGTPSLIGYVGVTGGEGMGSTVITMFQGTIGLNYAQAMENSASATTNIACSFFGNGYQLLRIHLEY